jgi:hypothetical protein
MHVNLDIRFAKRSSKAISCCAAVLLYCSCASSAALADTASYPTMAPVAAYRMDSQAEIALARSAAPASISNDAEVMVMGSDGYHSAAKGKNGFVCIVERSWASDFDDTEFWNQKARSPICFNAAAARSVLPTFLERSKWVLGGMPKDEMLEHTKAAIANGKIGPPEVGAMCYMMSKDGYLGDAAGGHWHPHLMFFLPHAAGNPPDWGANLPGSPVLGGEAGLDPASIYYVPVAKWSDGSDASMKM